MRRKSQAKKRNFKKNQGDELPEVEKIDGKEYIEGREVLNDVSPETGKKFDWRGKKLKNGLVKEAYTTLSHECSQESDYFRKKADRLHDCACFLTFNEYLKERSYLKAKHLNSCRVPLCPVCKSRRSMKIHKQVRAILEALKEEQKYAYICVTFTVPNVTGEELAAEITKLMEAWNRLVGYVTVEKAIKGWYRALEINHDVNEYITSSMYNDPKRKAYYNRCGLKTGSRNPNFNMFHPHFHCIMAVNKSYFKKNTYIKRDEWLELWKKATRDPSITQVDVRKIRPKDDKTDIVAAICETAKYAVKDTDYITPEDWDLACSAIKILDKALHKRRLIAFGGVMKEKHKELNLGNPENEDLDRNEKENGEFLGERTFFWHWGYEQYLGT